MRASYVRGAVTGKGVVAKRSGLGLVSRVRPARGRRSNTCSSVYGNRRALAGARPAAALLSNLLCGVDSCTCRCKPVHTQYDQYYSLHIVCALFLSGGVTGLARRSRVSTGTASAARPRGRDAREAAGRKAQKFVFEILRTYTVGTPRFSVTFGPRAGACSETY